MKEFLKNNKKSAIIFACSVVVIIACAIVGSIVSEDTDEISLTEKKSAENVSAQSYITYNAGDLEGTESGAESAVSEEATTSEVAE